MKKQITILCCALSLILLFTGCSKKEKTIPDIDREQIKNNIEVMVDQIVADLPDDEAGGTVTDLDGNELQFLTKTSIKASNGVA